MTVMFSANGKSRQTEGGTTIADLLSAAKLEPMQVFVEYNGEPLDRALFATTVVGDGDSIEIVQMVGGG